MLHCINNFTHIEQMEYINELYDNLTYFDLYGHSIIAFVILTILVSSVFMFTRAVQHREEIADDWVNQRCKPQHLLVAGWITKPDGVSSFQYTRDNFQYCVQNILKDVSNQALQPVQFLLQGLTQLFGSVIQSLQDVRGTIQRLRGGIASFTEDVLQRVLNVMLPMQKMFIAVMDTFQKIQGSMTASLYTMLGTYYVLQSLMGAILELIVKMLVALSIIIVGLWISPFTWPAAASMSAVFLALAVPLSIVTYFMTEVLHIKTSAVPKLRCFDGDTPLMLSIGISMPIKHIQVGDVMADGGVVTATMQLSSDGVNMYWLNGTLVSESHLVYYQGNWIRVLKHPEAVKLSASFDSPYIYCLNTTTKRICINGTIFSDWDEIVNDAFSKIKQLCPSVRLPSELHRLDLMDAKKHNELVKLNNQHWMPISHVGVGTLLEGDKTNKVYGVVQLANKRMHLLTTSGKFIVKTAGEVTDYNHILDKFMQ